MDSLSMFFPILVLLGAVSVLDALSPVLLLNQCAAQEMEGSVFICPL